MIRLTENEVYTDKPETMRGHRLGTEVYFSRCTRLSDDSVENFEEVRIEDVPSNEPIEEESYE